LVYIEEYLTRAEAMAREKWLKSGVGREWLKVKLGRASPPSAD
jgi:predicted GIY-YIG superfamily endonuclease